MKNRNMRNRNMRTRKNNTKKNRENAVKNAFVFSDKEYNSNDGMLTTVWGPGIWHYLHTMSFNYPVHPSKTDKIHYRDFVINLKHVLPCGKCRTNLTKNFKVLPLTMKEMVSRATFSKYIYDLHEVVNKMLCKNSGLSYENVRERYEFFRSRCSKRTTKKHKGCTEPIIGEKSKCLLRIVPQKQKCETLEIDKKCVSTVLL